MYTKTFIHLLPVWVSILFSIFASDYQNSENHTQTNQILPKIEYKNLDKMDQQEIEKLYNESYPDSLKFLGKSKGVNKDSKELLLNSINKKNDCVKDVTLTRKMGKLVFSDLIPKVLSSYSALTILNLSGNNITDCMLEKNIQSFIKLPNLTSLDLSGNKTTKSGIGIKGFKILFDFFDSQSSKIITLKLDGNRINEENSLTYLLNRDVIKIKNLFLRDQDIGSAAISNIEYEKKINELNHKFPQFVCILREKDTFLLGKSVLPINKLKVVYFSENNTPHDISTEHEEKALKHGGKNAPIKVLESQNKWPIGASQNIMAIDPSGSGTDATGYAIITINKNREYLITEAGGIKGNGLSDTTFDKLVNLIVKQKINYVAVEHNYNNGAYLTSIKKHYQLKKLEEKLSNQATIDQLENEPEFYDHKIKEAIKGERIVKTLRPLLEEGRLFMEHNFFYKDYEAHPSLFKELASISENFKSQNTENGLHDDIVDALEMQGCSIKIE